MAQTQDINPRRGFWELSRRLPDDCILAADSGSTAAWYALDLRARAGMLGSLSGGLATMGSAVPYAFAAKMAHPGRLVVAVVGDGAMQMNGMNCLITIARHWQRWADPRLIVLVLNNRDLNFVTWEQRGMAGEPKFEASQTLPDLPYADYARMLGLEGIRVERTEELGPALDVAFAAGKPCVLDILSEANLPPFPLHTTRAQAKKYFEAIEKGDPEADEVRAALAQQGLTEQ